MRQEYFKILARMLTEKLSPKLVLDVGCANGLLVKEFRKIGVLCFGVDLYPSGEGTVRGDARYLPFKNNVFDLVTAIEVLEHIKETQLVISEIYRVLKPKGFVFMTTPTQVRNI